MGAIASQNTRLTIVSQPFVQTQIKETMTSNAENVSIWWRHDVLQTTVQTLYSYENWCIMIQMFSDVFKKPI